MEVAEDFFTVLIEAVREEKVLYAKSCPGYMDKIQKQKAWEKISERTGKPKDECEKRWFLLREKYGRELRKIDLASGSAAAQELPWPYLESMSFLRDHIKKRKTRDNAFKTDESSASINLSDETLMSPPTPITFSQDSSSTSETPRKRRKTESCSDREVADKFKEVLEIYKKKAAVEEGEDEIFMKNILKMMEPLPIHTKDSIKKKMFDMVMLERRQLYKE